MKKLTLKLTLAISSLIALALAVGAGYEWK